MEPKDKASGRPCLPRFWPFASFFHSFFLPEPPFLSSLEMASPAKEVSQGYEPAICPLYVPVISFHMRPSRILPAIVISQFLGTSGWFAGNAVIGDLSRIAGLGPGAASSILSSVQLGFITGTLVFAFLNISDRFSPRLVFLVSALLAALANAGVVGVPSQFLAVLALRFLVGFFLAGIYPVGMKIAAGWYREGLGNAIGFLVGALILGSGFPYLIRSLGGGLPWKTVLLSVSAAIAVGGFVMYLLVPDGPHLHKGSRFDPRALALVFKGRDFRASAFGYFGHMWELYAFYAFAPFVLTHSCVRLSESAITLWTFFIFAAGSAGCIFAGLMSLQTGSSFAARLFLSGSGICCLLSPLVCSTPDPVVLGFFLVWGFLVVGDSAQFSALNARRAPKEYVGSALTIVNCIGFAITIGSIQLLGRLTSAVSHSWLLFPLVMGPAFGMFFLWGDREILEVSAQDQ